MSTIWLETIHLALIDYHTTTSLLLIIFGVLMFGAILSVRSGLDNIVAELKKLNSSFLSDETITELENTITQAEKRDDRVCKE
jgi:uncharacterized protein YccT (UPF0319 family)